VGSYRAWWERPAAHGDEEGSVFTVDSLLAGREDGVRAVYARIVEAGRGAGTVVEDAKKSCVHLAADAEAPAFAGVHPRKTGVLLNLRTAAPISSPRVRKTEQLSRHRFFNEILVESPGEVDAELAGWLREAYELSAVKA
jgi:hypothetical protein